MPLEGPCDAPGCTRTDNSCRFRPATKPELAGKQVCPNRRCQFWGGNRDEASEKATKEAKAAAAAAAKQGSTAAGVVSPRRQGRAEPLPAGTQPTAQTVPAVPVGGGATWFNPTTWFGQQQAPEQAAAAAMAGMAAGSASPDAADDVPHDDDDAECACYGCRGLSDGIERRVQGGYVFTQREFADPMAWDAAERANAVSVPVPTTRWLLEVLEIFGQVRHNPLAIGELIDPADDDTRVDGGMDPIDLPTGGCKPLFLVDGIFNNLEIGEAAHVGGMPGLRRRLVRWVTQEALLDALKGRYTPSSFALVQLVAQYTHDWTRDIFNAARASGLGGSVHCAKAQAVERQAEAAELKAQEAMDTHIAATADGTLQQRQAEIDERAAASELALALGKFIAARDARAAAAAPAPSPARKRRRA